MAVQLIGLGAGGHAKVIIEILNFDGRYKIAGLLDSNPKLMGQIVLEIPILGTDDMLGELYERGMRHFFLGIGSVGNAKPRRQLYELGLNRGMQAVNAIHPAAMVSPSAIIGGGITVMAGAIINACAKTGVNVIINTGAIVEHDCVLGDHTHVSTGARLAGAVRVGASAHIGAGATVRQGITIGDGSVVGAGAVVIKDVPSGVVVAGVPARQLVRSPLNLLTS